MEYEKVIGLEIHIEFSTKTKMFCSCKNEFGTLPNINICPVCTGVPGSLPVINRKAVDYAIKAGIVFNCKINNYNRFDRKNYFYPDLPKAYQISQLYFPICTDGNVLIEYNGNKKNIRIHEMHLEEDAGKLIHDKSDKHTFIDYNRCGIPLLEIVTEPDFSDSEQVIAFLENIKEKLIYLNISDCKMQEGSMRVDVNISVRKKGEKNLGTRSEIKNINSFKAIQKVIEFEYKRHIDIIESGNKVLQETRRWNDKKNESYLMRSKENINDYRYFPEPDLPPLYIDEIWIKDIMENIPEMPDKKRKRYINDFGLNEYDSKLLTSDKNISELFEKVVCLCNNPKETANLLIGELLKLLNETNTKTENINIKAENIAELINMISNNIINRNAFKETFEQMFKNNINPVKYVEENNLKIINNEDVIYNAIKEVLKNNSKSIDDFKKGKTNSFGFLMGQLMKILDKNADPKLIKKLLDKELNCILNK